MQSRLGLRAQLSIIIGENRHIRPEAAEWIEHCLINYRGGFEGVISNKRIRTSQNDKRN